MACVVAREGAEADPAELRERWVLARDAVVVPEEADFIRAPQGDGDVVSAVTIEVLDGDRLWRGGGEGDKRVEIAVPLA